MTDRTELGHFLRARRAALRPTDVGLMPGGRRRTPGLRREEVAMLANISTDYYERLEQARGVNPSETLLAALARALRLSTDARDHLYAVAGYQPPPGLSHDGYADPGLTHILDSLKDDPAQIVDDLGTVVIQNPMAVALLGPLVDRPGHEANGAWLWFVRPEHRGIYAEEEHEAIGRTIVADLRASVFRHGHHPAGQALVDELREKSTEFAALWELGEVATVRSTRKSVLHSQAGRLDLHCDIVLSPGTSKRLFLYRPRPGTETAERLEFLRPPPRPGGESRSGAGSAAQLPGGAKALSPTGAGRMSRVPPSSGQRISM
ncbi:helix-turn-helix transcriptional regulator [Streptomyces spirodelae]|uniref:Helix-turn-helix domain-containing protein n=1 Tax=Streptomyces spirodelae TaxID=2812904 RepID=A0ABS3WU57_9ACTN|nr:helix-turn-helix transcriptional regulator [Streptomyces spirodelae]MBO8186396.1 helix-turn-helix domain-containing protein [Streptomyces spirodelae]